MSKITFGFLRISFEKDFEIIVDEKSGQKYFQSGHDYYDADSICGGMTIMLDENGKPDRLTREEIEYLKSIAHPINIEAEGAAYGRIRHKKKEPCVAYIYREF